MTTWPGGAESGPQFLTVRLSEDAAAVSRTLGATVVGGLRFWVLPKGADGMSRGESWARVTARSADCTIIYSCSSVLLLCAAGGACIICCPILPGRLLDSGRQAVPGRCDNRQQPNRHCAAAGTAVTPAGDMQRWLSNSQLHTAHSLPLLHQQSDDTNHGGPCRLS